MKKAKSARRRSTAKESGPPESVTKYIARAPERASGTLKKLRAAVRAAVGPGAAEIISYGIPAFKDKRVLVWYAAFADHCSLFPTASVIATFKDELAGFSTLKGTIHIPLGKPVPAALIKKIVKERLRQAGESRSSY
ncbi:MAG TPA: DUF1801 domain-containing protein [Candidatus Acidoferrales bacterium]|nr:DUF1801 domain-containing protein [Candidatus Acidoferrales bacterium]